MRIQTGSEGCSGGDHQEGSNTRATSDDGRASNGKASEANLQLAFNEGWAEYYAVATSDFETSNILKIPGFGPREVTLPSHTGFGEDDELSAAETFLTLDEVGIKADGNPYEADIADPCSGPVCDA